MRWIFRLTDDASVCASLSLNSSGTSFAFAVCRRGFATHAANGFAQTFTRLKCRDAARGDDDCLTRLRIPSFATTTFANDKTTERNQLHLVAGLQRTRDLGKHLIDHLADAAFRYVEFAGERVNKISFCHRDGYTQRTLPLLPRRATPACGVCGLLQSSGES